MSLFRKKEDKTEIVNQQQAKIHSWLAKVLVSTFIGTIVLTFNFVGTGMILEFLGKDIKNQDFKEIIILIITSETALISTVLGFYFGSKNSNKSK